MCICFVISMSWMEVWLPPDFDSLFFFPFSDPQCKTGNTVDIHIFFKTFIVTFIYTFPIPIVVCLLYKYLQINNNCTFVNSRSNIFWCDGFSGLVCSLLCNNFSVPRNLEHVYLCNTVAINLILLLWYNMHVEKASKKNNPHFSVPTEVFSLQ